MKGLAKMGMNKTVYIAISADIIHSGHVNIIREGQNMAM